MSSYTKVENHRLIGRTIPFVIVDVYSSPDRRVKLVKLKGPKGYTQIRQYVKSKLHKTINVEPELPGC